MERRIAAWLFLTLGIFLLYSSMFGPQPDPEADGPEQNPDVAAADDKAGEAPGQAGLPPEPAQDRPDAPAPEVEAPLQFVGLGSADPLGNFRLLITLSNEGAVVHRAQLAPRRYRDLHDESGYFGHVEPVETADGLEVQFVGAGTPAGRAGLQVGDVIQGISSESTKTLAEFSAAIAAYKPGDTVSLSIKRGNRAPMTVEIDLARRPLEVMRPEDDNVRQRDPQAAPPESTQPSFLLALSQVYGERIENPQAHEINKALSRGRWNVVTSSDTEATFEKRLPEYGLLARKRYSLKPIPEGEQVESDFPGYDFNLEISFENIGQERMSLAYTLEGPTGLPTEGWWYVNRIGRGWFQSSGLRDVVVRFKDRSTQSFGARKIHEGDVDPMSGTPVAYVGVDSLYFGSVLIPQKEIETQWFDRIDAIEVGGAADVEDDARFANVTCRLQRSAWSLEPGDSRSDSYRIFCGPKSPPLLKQYTVADRSDYSLEDMVYYGMFWWIAKPMLGLLEFFYAIVGNYGIAIVMLTVVVRACMFPLSRKQSQNMIMMQKLQPEMKRITEKYKNDMEKRAKAMQDLYRKYNYNPLGGCLMPFLQLPIFIGLYRSLMLDIELRQAPLISEAVRWCSNLGAPDMLLNWSGWMPQFVQGWLGPYLNVLPLVSVVLFLLQQKLFMPPPTNEQQAMQQKVMKFMSILIGFFFYKVASGLCLYFIASSLWGIGERKLLPSAQSQTPEELPAEDPTPSREERRLARAEEERSKRNGASSSKKNKSRSKKSR